MLRKFQLKFLYGFIRYRIKINERFCAFYWMQVVRKNELYLREYHTKELDLLIMVVSQTEVHTRVITFFDTTMWTFHYLQICIRI